MPKELHIKRKKKRPRTSQLRRELKKDLEHAILTPKTKILDLFLKDDQCYVGNLLDVIRILPNPDKYLHLSSYGYLSLNNRTKIFTIIGDPKTKQEDLKISFLQKLRTRIYDTIAFVDNLPLLCTKEKLWRRASLFGTVVDVHLPKPKKIFQKQDVIKGSIKVQHAGYGFVQFTSPYSVKRFCRRYLSNSHLRRHKKSRKKGRQRLLSKSQQPHVVQKLNESKEEEQIVTQELNYSNSNIEWSESGLESDFDLAPKRRRRTLTITINKTEIMEAKIIETITKQKKKIRRKRSLKRRVSLRRLFRMIQVFPLRMYKKLKKEYYHLKRQVRQAYAVELAQQREDDSE